MGFEPTVSTLGRSHVTTTPSPQRYGCADALAPISIVNDRSKVNPAVVPPTGLEPARLLGTGPQPAAYTIPPRGLAATLTSRQKHYRVYPVGVVFVNSSGAGGVAKITEQC